MIFKRLKVLKLLKALDVNNFFTEVVISKYNYEKEFKRVISVDGRLGRVIKKRDLKEKINFNEYSKLEEMIKDYATHCLKKFLNLEEGPEDIFDEYYLNFAKIIFTKNSFLTDSFILYFKNKIVLFENGRIADVIILNKFYKNYFHGYSSTLIYKTLNVDVSMKLFFETEKRIFLEL